MAVAAIIAMRHHEAQMEALIEEERLANAQESADNQDIYAKHAEKLEKKKKRESILNFGICQIY